MCILYCMRILYKLQVIRLCLARKICDLNDKFSSVATREKEVEVFGTPLKPLLNMILPLNLPFCKPLSHILPALRVSILIVEHNESLELRAHRDEGEVVLEAFRLSVVVFGDGAADCDTCKGLHAR